MCARTIQKNYTGCLFHIEGVWFVCCTVCKCFIVVSGRKKKKKVLKASEVYSSTSSDGEGEERRKSSSSRWVAKNEVFCILNNKAGRPISYGSGSGRPISYESESCLGYFLWPINKYTLSNRIWLGNSELRIRVWKADLLRSIQTYNSEDYVLYDRYRTLQLHYKFVRTPGSRLFSLPRTWSFHIFTETDLNLLFQSKKWNRWHIQKLSVMLPPTYESRVGDRFSKNNSRRHL